MRRPPIPQILARLMLCSLALRPGKVLSLLLILPAPSSLTHPKDSPDRLGVGLALGDSSGQPSPVSPPITSISKPQFSPSELTSRPPVGVPNLLDSTELTQSLHLSPSLAAPSQQSLVIERQNVSLSLY
jgi:hypothetical protein